MPITSQIGPHRASVAELMDDGKERTIPEIQLALPDIPYNTICNAVCKMVRQKELLSSGPKRPVRYRAAADHVLVGKRVASLPGPVEDGLALARAWRRAGERGEVGR